jgi:glycerophosphoryl diester phosphodiesterase
MPSATSTNWCERRVINFAHQGGAHEGPSSTLFAIQQALDAGAGAIELDVHATADRHLVVCHDETVDRTSSASGEICNLSLAEVRALDNAYWFIPGADVTPGRPAEEYPFRGKAPQDRQFGFATLEEVLLTFPGVLINLDIKRTDPEVVGYEQLLAETLVKCGRSNDVIVASFNDLAIRQFRALSPGTPTSAATMETAEFYRALHAGEEPTAPPVVAFQVPETFGAVTLVDQAFVDAAHELGIAVHVWTVNDETSMRRLVDLGVDGIISDRPRVLAQVLGAQTWKPGVADA